MGSSRCCPLMKGPSAHKTQCSKPTPSEGSLTSGRGQAFEAIRSGAQIQSGKIGKFPRRPRLHARRNKRRSALAPETPRPDHTAKLAVRLSHNLDLWRKGETSESTESNSGAGKGTHGTDGSRSASLSKEQEQYRSLWSVWSRSLHRAKVPEEPRPLLTWRSGLKTPRRRTQHPTRTYTPHTQEAMARQRSV